MGPELPHLPLAFCHYLGLLGHALCGMNMRVCVVVPSPVDPLTPRPYPSLPSQSVVPSVVPAEVILGLAQPLELLDIC